MECPIDKRIPRAIANRGGPCTGGLCLCGAAGEHIRMRNGEISCGWCRTCLKRHAEADPDTAPAPPLAKPDLKLVP